MLGYQGYAQPCSRALYHAFARAHLHAFLQVHATLHKIIIAGFPRPRAWFALQHTLSFQLRQRE